jgi:hypothetical protein
VTTVTYRGVQITGNPAYINAIRGHLDTIASTSCGEKLLEQIAMSPHFVGIRPAVPGTNNNDWSSDSYTNPNARIRNGLNGPVGAGTSATVFSNLNSGPFYNGSEPWMNAPDDVTLFHELNHARQAVRGEMQPGRGQDPWVGWRVNNRELDCVGLGPWDNEISENAYRVARGLPPREYY